MSSDDSIFAFPYLRTQWHVSVIRPMTAEDIAAGSMGHSIAATMLIEAKDETEAARKMADEFPQWTVQSIKNGEDVAAERLAQDIAYIWRNE